MNRNDLLESLIDLSKKCQSTLGKVQTALIVQDKSGKSLDLNLEIPGSIDSWITVSSRANLIFQHLEALDTNNISIPSVTLQRALELILYVEDILNVLFGKVESLNGISEIIDSKEFTALGNSGSSLSFSVDIVAFSLNLDNLWITVGPLVEKTNEFDATGQATAWSSRVKRVEAETKRVERLTENLQATLNEIAARRDQLVESSSKAESLTIAAQTYADRAKDLATAATADSDMIKQVVVLANALAASIQTNQSIIFSASDLVDTKRKELDLLQQDSPDNQLTIRRQIKEISDTIDAAEAMLTGSTNVGLAETYGKRRDAIQIELSSAKRSFYWSIAFLFLFSIPLALFVVPIEIISSIPTLKNMSNISVSPNALGSVLARAILVIPGIWLVRVAARRYDRLFRLNEHYAFKFSIAASVEGFKKQAPEYKSEVAALTYANLMFNPTNQMDGFSSDEKHPSPLIEKIMSFIEGKRKPDPQRDDPK